MEAARLPSSLTVAPSQPGLWASWLPWPFTLQPHNSFLKVQHSRAPLQPHVAMCFLLSPGKAPNSLPHSGLSAWPGPALEGSGPSSAFPSPGCSPAPRPLFVIFLCQEAISSFPIGSRNNAVRAKMDQAVCWVVGIQWGKRLIQSLPSELWRRAVSSAFKSLCKNSACLYKAMRHEVNRCQLCQTPYGGCGCK